MQIADIRLCLIDFYAESGATQQGAAEARADVEKRLVQFLSRLVKSELEDFELDKTSEFHMNIRQGEFNQHAAVILSNVYEVRGPLCESGRFHHPSFLR